MARLLKMRAKIEPMPEAPFSTRLLRQLACVLGVGLLAVSSIRAQTTQTIGSPTMTEGNAVDSAGTDLDLSPSAAFYIPFAFNFADGQYALDSVQLLLMGQGASSLSDISLLVSSTLGTDRSTLPPVLMSLSATGPLPGTSAVYAFQADSPVFLTSGSTYYLRMAYAGSGGFGGSAVYWVSTLMMSGTPPAIDPNNPAGPGTPPSGGGHGEVVTLVPVTAIFSESDHLTYRSADDVSYTDHDGTFGITLTATAVPEPSTFALLAVGTALGAGIF